MSKIPIYAWYFPNWHPDPRNDKWHGQGWTEWECAKHATPRFSGHKQPLVPLWGYEDESDPKVMQRKIETAMSYGIDGFLWDMYWFEDGGYRFNALDKGFFGAKNNKQFKIALMWCNHDPIYVHPASYHDMGMGRSLRSGNLSSQAVLNCTEHLIANYFWRENYLRIDDKIYFIIWSLPKFVNGLGGIESARLVLEDFRSRVRRAGLGEMYLGTVLANLKGYQEGDKTGMNTYLRALGIDGCASYSWPLRSDLFPSYPYEDFVEDGIQTFAKDTSLSDLPFSITVSAGWDSSPRTVQSDIYENVGYPFSAVTTGVTPEKFE